MEEKKMAKRIRALHVAKEHSDMHRYLGHPKQAEGW
jgi:hypothetical protein